MCIPRVNIGLACHKQLHKHGVLPDTRDMEWRFSRRRIRRIWICTDREQYADDVVILG